MSGGLILAIVLALGEVTLETPLPPAPLEEAVQVPDLARKADVSYLVRRWDRAIPLYEQIVAANPTVGFYWYRLGACLLADSQFEKAIAAFTRADELGGYQWNPVRIVYHGEAAWGIAGAHARLGQNQQAVEWTQKSLKQGLRDIRQFHGPHFADLLKDPEFRKLVWHVDTAGLSRDEGMRLDVRFLAHEGRRLHFDPFRAASAAEFDGLAQSLESDIPTLTDDQVLVRMMAMMRLLGDGHTGVRPKNRSASLPVRFFAFPEGLYITAAREAQADLVGSKVLRIGRQSAAEALRTVSAIVSHDNPMNVLSTAPWMLGVPAYLRGLGIVGPESSVSLELEDVAGKTRQVELAPLEPPAKDRDWIGTVSKNQKPVKSMSRRPGMYWFEELEGEKAVYCQINGIGNDPQESFKKFCARLFAAFEQPHVEALILDLRFNGGGDTFENVPLIEGLIRCEKLGQPGRLFVIIGRETFSAAQNTTSELERRTKAMLVGEPTGSCPNFIGESLRIPLPYTEWVASVSDLWWQHSMAMDYRIWTHPQIYAPPTAEAFRAGRDTAMEAIARYRALREAPKK